MSEVTDFNPQKILLTTDYIKMAEFFRFRSINALLGEYQELEKQNIYFASPEELNDPMEGFRDVLWNGDRIVWLNLFKHYASYLNHHLLTVQFLGHSVELNLNSIPILVSLARPRNLMEKELFDEVWYAFLDMPYIKDIIVALSNRPRNIRYSEIEFVLQSIHIILIDNIKKSLISHNLVPEYAIGNHNENLPSVDQFSRTILYYLKNSEEKEPEELNKVLHFIQQYSNNLNLELNFKIINFSRRIPNIDTTLIQNELSLSDFPKIYLDNLIDLAFPIWRTACFTECYDNLSVWAKYADGHKGVCLIFEENINWKSTKFRTTEFRKVTYKNKPIEIDFFRSIGMSTVSEIMETWYKDEKGNISECASHIGDKCKEDTWREGYWNNFLHYITTKNRDWEYEQEYRVILYDNVRGVIEKSDHTLNYDFESLNGIIFGIRTSTEDKIKIIEIIRKKCKENKRTDFKFFQSYYSAENGDIRKYEIQLPFSGNR